VEHGGATPGRSRDARNNLLLLAEHIRDSITPMVEPGRVASPSSPRTTLGPILSIRHSKVTHSDHGPCETNRLRGAIGACDWSGLAQVPHVDCSLDTVVVDQECLFAAPAREKRCTGRSSGGRGSLGHCERCNHRGGVAASTITKPYEYGQTSGWYRKGWRSHFESHKVAIVVLFLSSTDFETLLCTELCGMTRF
jgi:hypothetical protein